MPEYLFLAGRAPTKPEPLARFLPPIPEGVVGDWLQANLPHSTEPLEHWVLDPFGTAPRTAVETARLGYRVLVAANNPITRFLIEMAADPPSEDELRAALAELATARKGEERLEPHIRSLYITRCDECRGEVEAEAYLWDRGDSSVQAEKASPTGPFSSAHIYARIYHCPNCSASGEYPATEMDQARAAQFSSGGLHRARALERIASLDDPDRHHAEEALSVYLPRAVYALFTLINKLDGLQLPAFRRKQIIALLLSACDQANTLWPYPSGRARPRALTIPPRFRENNVWLALEQAISQWASNGQRVSLWTWPELPPPEGGICIFEGRLKDLIANAAEIPIGAVVSPLPRPNQAFWTLSALWAGWLWGKDAVGPFKNVLRRRRYDWAWHTTALLSALESLTPYLKTGTPFFGLIGEAEPGFLSAALISAENAGFELFGLAMPIDGGQAQISWKRTEKIRVSEVDPNELIRSSTRAYLLARGEPSHYLNLHAAALVAYCQAHVMPTPEQGPGDSLAQFNNKLEDALSYRSGFLRFAGSEKSLEVGYWWLRETEGSAVPLADRIEVELVRYLIAHPGASLLEIYQALCKHFPGLLTPGTELIHVCLESYGEESPSGSGHWRLLSQNAPQARRADLENITSLINHLAVTLEYRQEGDKPLLWIDKNGEVVFAWYVTASAMIGEFILGVKRPAKSSLIVMPGGRANLVAYKLQQDPRLRQSMEEGWRFVKFRQVRWLAHNPSVTRASLDSLLTQDSLTFETPQLRLF